MVSVEKDVPEMAASARDGNTHAADNKKSNEVQKAKEKKRRKERSYAHNVDLLHKEGGAEGDSRAVGARVEVLWDGEPFAAEVVRCYTTGQYDVVYEEDGQSGTFLTPAEHQLLPLPKKKTGGRGGGSSSVGGGGSAASVHAAAHLARIKAEVAGPSVHATPPTFASSSGEMCTGAEEHGGSGDGAQTQTDAGAGAGGAGAKKKKIQQPVKNKCSVEGCATNVVGRGLCFKHGGKGTCIAPGCTTNAHGRGLCWKHGAKETCIAPGCTNKTHARGLCKKHGAKGACTAPDGQ
jgi:hypothetical protein